MKSSQRQTTPASHLTRPSSTTTGSSPTLVSHHNSTSDLSALVDASHISHAISSTYHALTTHALHQHNRRQNSANLHSIRASHANRLSSSLEHLNVNLPSHLYAQTIQSVAGITPKEYLEGPASFPCQQYSTYQPLLAPLFNTAQQTHARLSPDDNFSAKAELGADDCRHAQGCNGDRTYWIPQKDDYLFETRNNKDMAEWGQNLAGVGAQFDIHLGYIPPMYVNGVLHES